MKLFLRTMFGTEEIRYALRHARHVFVNDTKRRRRGYSVHARACLHNPSVRKSMFLREPISIRAVLNVYSTHASGRIQ